MSAFLGNVPHLRARSVRLWQLSTSPPTDVTSWVCLKVGQDCWFRLVYMKACQNSWTNGIQAQRYIIIFPLYILLSFCCGTCLTGHHHINNAERRLAPKHSRREVALSTDTEMRDNYRQPKQKPELLGNHSHYSYNTDPTVACRGIGIVC